MALGDREFTSEEVAALCGVTRVTVADWIARGRINVRWTAGGHRRIPRASLAEFMEQQGYAVPRAVASRRALVFVLDDEAPWRERLRAALEATGDYDVEAHPPTVDALLRVGACAPDVLVVDTQMPGFDTRQLLEVAHREPALAGMVVLALTTYDEEAAGVRRFGADASLARDRVGELPAMLARVLTERQRRTDGRASVAPPEPGDADGARPSGVQAAAPDVAPGGAAGVASSSGAASGAA